ncbi:MAG TPA: hypothetical protein VGM15_03590, partial [Burkholderiaceae bacterium]
MQEPASAARRRRHPFWIGLGVVAVLLAGLLIGARWLLASSSGMTLALRAAATLGGFDVRLQNPSGRLLDVFGVEQIEIGVGGTRVVIRNLQARVRHWSLRPLQIAFDSIRASDVEVHTGSARSSQSTALQPPQRIAAPLEWEVGELRIDAFEYWGAADSAAEPRRLRSIRAGLLSTPGGYRLSAGHFETTEVELEAAATLGTQWPFPLQATGRIRSRLAQRPVQADLAASGSLDQLDLSARLTGSDLGGALQAHLTSFTAPYLARVEANLQGVDPAHWHAGAPHALLDVRIDLRPVAQRASQLAGALDAVNHADGPLDSQRIPIRALRGRVVADFAGAGSTTIDVTALEAQLERGSASGRMQIAARDGTQRWSVDAALRQVDLSRLHSRVRPLRVDGSVHLENRPVGDDAAVFDTQIAARGDLRARDPVAAELTFDMQGDPQRWTLASAHLALNSGTFDAQGTLERSTSHLQLHGAAHALDAGLLVRMLRSRIDGRFDIDAAIAPEPRGVVRFELTPSSLCWPVSRCWPAHGHGVVELSSSRQLHADAELVLQNIRLQAHGALDGSQGHLAIDVVAPQLADVDSTLHGALDAHAVLSGAWDAPDIDLHARVQGLRAFGQTAGSISVAASGKAQREAALELDASIEALGRDGEAAPWLQAASVHAQGTARNHSVSLQATLQGSRHLSALARGGLAGESWSGQLMQANLDGPQPFQLSEPAPLSGSASAVSFGPARLEALGVSVQDAWVEVRSQVLMTRGRFDGLRPPQATPLGGVSLDAGADPLKLRGQWNLTLGEHASGQIAIERESGDLRPSLEAGTAAPLGLRELSARIQVVDDQAQGDFSMDSERAGRLTASLRATLRHGADRKWGLDRRQPWHVEVAGQLPGIDALEPFFPQPMRTNLRIGGRLALSLRIDGTPEQPQATGTVEGDQLRLAWIDQGLRLQDGRLRARLDGDRIRIDEVRFEGPLRIAPADRRARDAVRGNPVGTISAAGEVGLSDLTGSLQVQVHQLPALQRSDRWLLLSGSGKVDLAPRQV